MSVGMYARSIKIEISRMDSVYLSLVYAKTVDGVEDAF